MITINNPNVIVWLIVILTAVMMYAVLKSVFRFFHPEELTENEFVPLEEIQYTNATVLSKDCFIKKSQGTKQPDHSIIYRAQFLTDDGRTLGYNVPVEIYDSLEKNQQGVLTVCDGRFFCFDGNTDN